MYELARNGKVVSFERYATGLVGISTRESSGNCPRNTDCLEVYSELDKSGLLMRSPQIVV